MLPSIVLIDGYYCIMLSMNKRINIAGAVGMLDAVLQKPILETGQKCPLVILMHGIMMRKEFVLLKKIAESLQLIGLASIRFDFKGLVIGSAPVVARG